MFKKVHPETAVILLIFLFFLGFALSINLPQIYAGFLTADQAVYFAMAQSIAYDLDIQYTKKDLIRYYESFSAGPQGIFLKRVKDPSGDRLFYAKSFAYALFAAPFVRVFGTNGPLVFHAVLLLLLLVMGRAFLAGKTGPPYALLYPLTFLFASLAWIYALWVSPDFFNLTLVFAVLFLWLYKIKFANDEIRTETSSLRRSLADHSAEGCGQKPSGGPQDDIDEKPSAGRAFSANATSTNSTDGLTAAAADPVRRGSHFSSGHAFLLSDASDYLAALLAGAAVYSKPPNIVLMGPLVLHHLLKKRYLKTGLVIAAFAVSLGLFFGANILMTSDWNFMGGERKTFADAKGRFPLGRPEYTFDNLGGEMTAEGYFGKFFYPLTLVPTNLFYYFFGRFTGVTWYFFPALLALILFFFARRSLEDWLMLLALAAGILIYIVFMPDNYGGGGGSIANRYFLNIYPFFFFLPGRRKAGRETAAAWIVAAVFIAQISFAPFLHSRYPATHVKRFPFKALPVEMSLVNNFPTNTNPDAFRVNIWDSPDTGMIHFLDDNYHPRLEPDGIWTRGTGTCEFILKTYYPVRELGIRLLNNPRANNKIIVTVDGYTQKITLQPKQWGTLRFPVKAGFVMRASHLHKVKIRASKESTPYFEDTASDERRILGVFFSIDITPQR